MKPLITRLRAKARTFWKAIFEDIEDLPIDQPRPRVEHIPAVTIPPPAKPKPAKVRSKTSRKSTKKRKR